jgi:hypothetical protein
VQYQDRPLVYTTGKVPLTYTIMGVTAVDSWLQLRFGRWRQRHRGGYELYEGSLHGDFLKLWQWIGPKPQEPRPCNASAMLYQPQLLRTHGNPQRYPFI